MPYLPGELRIAQLLDAGAAESVQGERRRGDHGGDDERAAREQKAPRDRKRHGTGMPAGYFGNGAGTSVVAGGNNVGMLDVLTGLTTFAPVNALTVRAPDGSRNSTDQWMITGKQFDPNAAPIAPLPPPAPVQGPKPPTSTGSNGSSAGNAVGPTLIQIIQQAFWLAYILTRPLGASIGDEMSQNSHKYGGLGLGATGTSYIFLGVIAVLVTFLTVTRRDQTPAEVAATG